MSVAPHLTSGFRVHPNYGNDLRQQYVNIMYALAKSDVLKDIASQIAGTAQNVNKMGNIAELVKEAEYALS